MKKLSLYFILLLIIAGFSACDEDFNKDVANPQEYEPEAEQDVNFQIANLESSYDLGAITGETFGIVKKTAIPNIPEGASVGYELHFSQTEDGANKTVVTGELSNDNYVVAKSDIQSMIEKVFGKRPIARDLYVKAVSRITSEDKQTVLVRSNQVKVAVTPEASVIEPAYYLIGDMNGWNPETVIKLNHSGDDVYEDPHFSIMLELTDPANFKIVPQSAVDALEAGGDFWGAVIGTAVDQDPSLEGFIVTENAQAIRIENAGYVKISLNMEEYTYTIEPIEINPFLYIPGNHQGWSPSTAPTLYTENMNMVYDGFAYLDGEYKFTSAPDWDNTNYGNGGEGKLSTDGGAGNLNAETGFYYLKVDLTLLTYEQTKTEWGIIGDATPKGWDGSTPMTYDRESNTWTVEATLEGGKYMKFRANDGWDINLGGNINKLNFGGSDIKIEESGTYSITLKLTNASDGYTCTITKQ